MGRIQKKTLAYLGEGTERNAGRLLAGLIAFEFRTSEPPTGPMQDQYACVHLNLIYAAFQRLVDWKVLPTWAKYVFIEKTFTTWPYVESIHQGLHMLCIGDHVTFRGAPGGTVFVRLGKFHALDLIDGLGFSDTGKIERCAKLFHRFYEEAARPA